MELLSAPQLLDARRHSLRVHQLGTASQPSRQPAICHRGTASRAMALFAKHGLSSKAPPTGGEAGAYHPGVDVSLGGWELHRGVGPRLMHQVAPHLWTFARVLSLPISAPWRGSEDKNPRDAGGVATRIRAGRAQRWNRRSDSSQSPPRQVQGFQGLRQALRDPAPCCLASCC